MIELETADTQFAAMYLGFSSLTSIRTRSPITSRGSCSRSHAVSGVQRADILGDRTFAMRVWLKQEKMAAHGISPSAVDDALARNNYLGARQNEGVDGLGQLRGQHRSADREEFRNLVVKEENGAVARLGDIADVVLGAENYDEDVRFNGQTATFMESGCFQQRIRSTSSTVCARRSPTSRRSCLPE